MNYCVSCGMPIVTAEDRGVVVAEGQVCKFCVGSDGKVKRCEQIFEGGVQFFMSSVSEGDRDLAERLVRKNMKNQPLWENKDEPCLNGAVASDEEFKTALEKLQA